MKLPRLVLVDNQMSGKSFVSIGPLILVAIGEARGMSIELVRFPRMGDFSTFLNMAVSADIVAFSTVCSNYPRVMLLAISLKALHPELVIVLGGPQASATAAATLRAFPAVDLVIRGEAETGWAAFLDQAKEGAWNFSKIPGAVWNSAGGIEETEGSPVCDDLDLIPMPHFEAVKELPSHGTARIEVGRGCPYNCTYCSTSAFFSRKYRMKTPSRIIAEMDQIHALSGILRFDFVHDMFTAKQDLLRDICRELKDRPYRWGCWSRADVLNDDLLHLLHESGCVGFFIGLETGSSRLQRIIRKNLDIQQSIRNLRQAKKMGFSITASIMLGYPGEKIADLRESLLLVSELMAGLADQVNLLPFVPLAGTDAAKRTDRYQFDGKVSNMVETEKGLTQAEAALISSNFDLFSAFYHPVDNEYHRADYLALVILLDNLKDAPHIQRFVLERDRAGFIDFMATGRFGIDVYRRSDVEITESMLKSYALRSARGWPVPYLMHYAEVARKVASAPHGFQESFFLPAACADLVFPRQFLPVPWRPSALTRYTLTKTWEGVHLGVC
jgi:tRNA A37 methylthiotransferase MiaB